MPHLVKFITDFDGTYYIKEERKWHFVINMGGSERAFCSGEVFGEGESSADYEEKYIKRGGITCESCLEKIKFIKSINL